MNDITHVEILYVDTAQGYADVRARQGTFRAGFRPQSALFQLPVQGEIWSAKKEHLHWHLVARQDTDSQRQEKLSEMEQGDVLLLSTGSTAVHSPNGLTLNERSMAAFYNQTFTSDESGEYTLHALPCNTYSLVIHYGVDLLVPDVDFTIDGLDLTITDDFATGVPIHCRYETHERIWEDTATCTFLVLPEAEEEFVT